MEPLFKMKVYWQTLGGHTHLRIFTGRNIVDGTCGKAGDLVMANEEFHAWIGGHAVTKRVDCDMQIEFIKEESADV